MGASEVALDTSAGEGRPAGRRPEPGRIRRAWIAPALVIVSSVLAVTAVVRLVRGSAPSFVEISCAALAFALAWATLGLQREIAERRRAEEALALGKELNDVFNAFPGDQMYGEVLRVVLEQMASPQGVFSYLDENGDSVAPSLTRDVWDRCGVAGKSITFPRATWGRTMAGRAVAERRTIYSNQAFSVPEGHIPMRRALATPVLYQGEAIGYLLVANKESSYGAADVERLEGIARSIAATLNARLQRDRQERQREQAEDSLRRSEERYRRIVETAHEGIWVIDADGRTTFTNRRMAEMLGYGVQEVLGAHFTKFLDEEALREGEERVELRGGRGDRHEFRLRRKDGSDLLALIEATPLLDDRGSYAGALVMASDVTERRRIEDQLRQSQKLEAVGRLAGGVAHDFNNLLTAILGDAQLLVAGLDPSDELRADALEIQAAAQKAAVLTRQLLAFGRKQIPELRVMDLREVVSAMRRMLGRLIGEDVELTTESDPVLGLVRVDPGQLEQVIVNLAVNARDAMPGGGRLTIETRNVEICAAEARGRVGSKAGPHVMLAVRDTGCGMGPEVESHLFEPFFTTKGLGKGTGLGLSTVYGIVKQCGGDIEVHTEPGKGTDVRIYLPRVDGPSEAAAEASDRRAASVGGTETVLVVEDEPMVRALAVRVLRGAGYDVLEAHHGEEALAIASGAKGQAIALVVTDVVMPRLGGPELAARLRAGRPDLRVLFVSGYDDRPTEEQGRADLRTAFLAKPFTPTDLAGKVREILDRRDAPDPGGAQGR